MQLSYLVSITLLLNSLLAGRIDVNECVGADGGAVIDTGGSETVPLYVVDGDGAPGEEATEYVLAGFFLDKLTVNDLETDFSNLSGFDKCSVTTSGNSVGSEVLVVLPLDEGNGNVSVDDGYTWKCKFVSASQFTNRRELRSLLVI